MGKTYEVEIVASIFKKIEVVADPRIMLKSWRMRCLKINMMVRPRSLSRTLMKLRRLCNECDV